MANQHSKSSPINFNFINRSTTWWIGVIASVLMIMGLLLRFTDLTRVPPGLYYDEMDHVFLGEALARYGTDITGNWSPVQLRPLVSLNVNAELTSVFHALAQKLVGFNGVAAHLPNAVFGVLTAIIAIGITRLLSGKWPLAVLAGAAVIANPWHIHLSRTAYEAGISLFFQTLILLGLVWFKKARSTTQAVAAIALTCIGIFWGFYTYHGAKLTVPAIVLYLVIWSFFQIRTRKVFSSLLLLIPIGLALILTGHTAWLGSRGDLGNRANELIVTGDYLAQEVDVRRKMSVNFPGKPLIINKGTVLVDEIIKRYAYVFDLRRLFSEGMEETFQFSLFVYPYFYLASGMCMLYGLYICWKTPDYRMLLGLTLLAPITSVVTQSYQSIFRAGLAYICLLIISGIGGLHLFTRLSRGPRKSIGWGILILLVIEVGMFGGNYLGRYPLVAANNHYFFEKLLAGYVRHTSNDVVVLTASPFTVARSLVSYLTLMPSLSQEQKAQFSHVTGSRFDLGRVLVTSKCSDFQNSGQTVIADPSKNQDCQLPEHPGLTETTPGIELASPVDSGTYYHIYRDVVCRDANIPNYVYVSNIALFDVLELSADELCHNWVRQTK